MSSESLLQIGVIAKPHGVRGELKVHLHFEGSEALREVERLWLESPRGERTLHQVEAVRGAAKSPILVLAGIVDRNGAEAIRGSTIWVARSDLPALEDGEYYLIDLIGAEVVLGERVIGSVREVRPDPSVDTLVIELEDGTVADQPLLDVWVGPFDAARRRLTLWSDDGLIS